MKPFYGQNLLTLYSDTDSIVCLLITLNFLDDFEEMNRRSLKQIFDLKDTGRPAPNAGQLGLAKVESEDKTIVEIVALVAKMYSITLSDASLKLTTYMKAKGIPTRMLKRLQTHQDYVDVILKPLVERDVTF